MTTEPAPWPYGTLQEVAAVLADTEDGLTGKQIGDLLQRFAIPDPWPTSTKRDRLTEAFVHRQNLDGSARRIITFVMEAMSPVHCRDRPDLFTLRRDRLNERLAFVGLHVTEAGRMARGAQATTLDEATKIATSIHDELRRRKTHPEVLRYCSVEVLKKDNFHTSLEATKSIFARLRVMTGRAAMAPLWPTQPWRWAKNGAPLIAINGLRTQTERDKQTGLMNLIKGLGGSTATRQPTTRDSCSTSATPSCSKP